MIRFEQIDENIKNQDDLKKLYLEAFPAKERVPFYILMRLAKKEPVEFLSIYDDSTWIGFIHTLVGEDVAYIFYFAIDSAFRQMGYGSLVLQEYRKIHPRLSLAIEPLKKDSANFLQREKRLEFYEKNGFEILNTKVVEMGVELELMGVSGSKIKKDEYQKLVRKFFDAFDSKEVLSVQEMRDADAYTIKNFIPGKELMKRAGEAIFFANYWKPGSKVLVVCGTGNNAGDGYVVADFLNEDGIDVELLIIKDKFSDDGRYYFDICREKGISYNFFDENSDYNTLLKKMDEFDYILDCIYGTGFKYEVKEPVYSLIRAINESKAYVISADINSGMDGDTGKSNICVKSDLTVSVGFLKRGLITEEAKKHIGKLVNIDIGIVRENN